MPKRTAVCRFLRALLLVATIQFPLAVVQADEPMETYAAFLQRMADESQFSGAVLVRKGGRILVSEGYGFANQEWQIPNRSDTKFRIGSVTKQFTAMSILILVNRGKLQLDDSIATYIADAPEAWSEITIRQLLNHTSGIVHSWNLPAFNERVATTLSLDDLISLCRDVPLEFEPGSEFSYSGFGYFVLGKIIETVSGDSYADFVRVNIFEPAGMADSGSDVYSTVLHRRASGYTRVDGGYENAPLIYMPNLTAGGNLFSTVEDLAKWDVALRERRFIPEPLHQTMVTPGLEKYGLGWRIEERNGYTVYEHTGGVFGFHAFIKRIPEIDALVVVLTNVAKDDVWERVAEGLENLAVAR